MVKGAEMDFLGHLLALKKRLIYSAAVFLISFIVAYYFAEEIYRFLLTPLVDYYTERGEQRYLIYTGLTEAFFTYLELAFYSALLISLPFLLLQLYIFMAPGLHHKEKMFIIPYFIVVPILFLCGLLFAYQYIFPAAWSFFLSFETPQLSTNLPIKLEARVSEYLSLVIHLIFIFGISFQLPVLITLLVRLGVIDVEFLTSKRRMAIIVIFIIAAIVTPPDAISQIGLALALILLYELSIIASKFIIKKRE